MTLPRCAAGSFSASGDSRSSTAASCCRWNSFPGARKKKYCGWPELDVDVHVARTFLCIFLFSLFDACVGAIKSWTFGTIVPVYRALKKKKI